MNYADASQAPRNFSLLSPRAAPPQTCVTYEIGFPYTYIYIYRALLLMRNIKKSERAEIECRVRAM